MGAIDHRMEDLAQIELTRLQEEKNRVERIKTREKTIELETNPVRKVILKAQQFLDENS
jgi:hypothetical protein